MKRSRLRSEQFCKKGQHMVGRGLIHCAQAFDQAAPVHRANLIQDHLSGLVPEANGNTSGIETALRGHRRNDHRVDMAVHFIGRDDQAGMGLSDLPPFRGVEANEIDVEVADYQRHSSRSHRAEEPCSRSKSRSSPARCMARKASSQPLRGREADRTTNWFPWTSTSTGPSRWH